MARGECSAFWRLAAGVACGAQSMPAGRADACDHCRHPASAGSGVRRQPATCPRLRSRDGALADELQKQLDDLRDEVVYLKVKLRKEGSVNRSRLPDVRDRFQDLRSRARRRRCDRTEQQRTRQSERRRGSRRQRRGSPAAVFGSRSQDTLRQTGSSTIAQPIAATSEIPAGQELDVRLDRELQLRHRAGRGSLRRDDGCRSLSGQRRADPGGLDAPRRGQLGAEGDAHGAERQPDGRVRSDHGATAAPIRSTATVTQALESEGIKGEVGKIGAGAGVGAIIGGILGGVQRRAARRPDRRRRHHRRDRRQGRRRCRRDRSARAARRAAGSANWR